jgi:enoyl-CoA hydratase
LTEPTIDVDYAKYEELKLALQDGIMTLTLSNPGKRNAITAQMSLELTTIWDDLWLDPEVKVIILTGEGADFCSGFDVGVMGKRAGSGRPPGPVHPVSRNARKHVFGIIECEKPVIAKVKGVAYGLGVNLALACDFAFVTEDARLCDSHVRAGMVAGDGGVLLWPLAIGLQRAKEYLMTGDPISGKVAGEIGLINRAMPSAELDAYVQAMAEKLRDLPPHAVNYTKTSLNVLLKQLASSAFEASVAYEVYTMSTADHKEAVKAMSEKRKGHYIGG